MSKTIKELLASAEGAIGSWISSTDSAVVEVLALAGCDYLAVDLEHSGIDLETLYSHVRAAHAHGKPILARMPGTEHKYLLRVLDAGVAGVIVPGITSAAETAELIRAIRYPPIGERGISVMARSSSYSAHGLPSVVELTERANREVLAGILVEGPRAVEEIEAIAATPGLDLIFIGPQDLSASLGRLGSRNDPDVIAAVHRIVDACAANGVSFGMPSNAFACPLSWQQIRALGGRMTTAGPDFSLLLAGARASLARLRTPDPAAASPA